MAQPQDPLPVKFFVAMLWKDPKALAAARSLLERQWGPLDFQGPDHSFTSTGYYDTEMGRGLLRRLVSFAELRSPEELAAAKVRCNEMEREVSEGYARGREEGASLTRGLEAPDTGALRLVNLDVGYLDHNKIVLASAKGLGQKIYLSQGIYADLVARYGHGHYQPFEWTFPDFKTGRYDAELAAMREKLLQQIKHQKI
jgi:hypothetical protein